MKTLFFCFLISALSVDAAAQNSATGIYMNYNQLENDKPAYTNNEHTRIRLNEFFGSPCIIIRQHGEKIKVFKDDVYAYKTAKGKIIRYWNMNQYHLLEKGNVWIYYRDLNVALGKGIRRERRYYFSVSGKEEILSLTIQNLKHSFPDKHLFKNFLDAQFRTDADLSLYNDHAKEFHVNYLLKTAI